MKKTTLEVRGLIAMLDFLAVEKRLKALPDVVDAVMNPGGDTATVTFDETRTGAEKSCDVSAARPLL